MTRSRFSNRAESNHQGNKHIKMYLKINSIVFFCSSFEVFVSTNQIRIRYFLMHTARTRKFLRRWPYIMCSTRYKILPWGMRNQWKMSLPATFLFQLIRCILSLASVNDHERCFFFYCFSCDSRIYLIRRFGENKLVKTIVSSNLKRFTTSRLESAHQQIFSISLVLSRRLDSLANFDHKPALMIVFLRLISFRVRWCLSGRYDATIQLIN